MSEFKGTKGEWKVIPTGALNDNELPLYYDVCIGNQSFLSTFKNESIGIDDQQQKANAKLISCAPEMLEYLIKVRYRLDNIDLELEQLIKKATSCV